LAYQTFECLFSVTLLPGQQHPAAGAKGALVADRLWQTMPATSHAAAQAAVPSRHSFDNNGEAAVAAADGLAAARAGYAKPGSLGPPAPLAPPLPSSSFEADPLLPERMSSFTSTSSSSSSAAARMSTSSSSAAVSLVESMMGNGNAVWPVRHFPPNHLHESFTRIYMHSVS